MWAKGGRLPPPEEMLTPLQARSQAGSALVAAGDLFDQVDNAPPQLRIVDAHKRLRQRQAVRGGKKVGHVGGRRRLTHPLMATYGLGRRCAFKKERHRDLEALGDLFQPAGTNPVGALLVFLYLLKSKPQ